MPYGDFINTAVTVDAIAISRFARNDTITGYVLSFRPQGDKVTTKKGNAVYAFPFGG